MKRQGKGRALLQALSRPRSSFSLLLFLLLCGVLSGCRNSSNELLETALRMREQDLQTMREDLLKLEFQNHALRRELGAVRQQTYPTSLRVSPELASQTYLLRRVTLGRSTAGYNEGNKPGDDALQVVIEPRDNDDHIIKAPGSAQITALDISPEGLKTPIGTWNIAEAQMRKSWRQGFLVNGYILILPWQRQPHSKNVRVIVRFQLSDGRVFEADRDVIVRLPPEMPRANGQFLPPMQEMLPVPHPAGSGNWPLPGSLQVPQGPTLQPTANWQSEGLEGAFRLCRPVPVYSQEVE